MNPRELNELKKKKIIDELLEKGFLIDWSMCFPYFTNFKKKMALDVF